MKPTNDIDSAEQTPETTEEPTVVSRADLAKAHETAENLVKQLADVPDGDLVGRIITNSLELLRDQTKRGDIKLINKSFEEMRYALKIFAPYRDVRKVSIFGSARTLESHEDYRRASAFGRAMAEAGWMVITGAGAGIMAA